MCSFCVCVWNILLDTKCGSQLAVTGDYLVISAFTFMFKGELRVIHVIIVMSEGDFREVHFIGIMYKNQGKSEVARISPYG